MAWCIQCGSAGTPELAIGVDEEGEAACAMHRVKSSRFEVATAAFSPQPAIQKREEAVMSEKEFKQCPGYEKVCTEQIGPTKELCGKCYGRRYYAQKNGGKTPKKKGVVKVRKSGEDVMREHGFTGTAKHSLYPLAALKVELLKKLAVIEEVEKMLGFQLAIDTAGGD